MKKIYLLFAFAFFTVYGQEPFITTWEIAQGSNMTVKVPIMSGSGVSYTIDYGDGIVLTNQTGPVNHVYSAPGIYTVTVSGNYSQVQFLSGTYPSKLKTIEQWGDTQWSSMDRAFKNCSNMVINAIDIPDLSQVATMKEMFYGCEALNQPLNNWDVSNVTDMESLFYGCESFNQPLNSWDVSNVTTMQQMFREATAFNQPLNDWNVSGVTNMVRMFKDAVSFNHPLDNWNTSNVTSLSYMFNSASMFNQPLNGWDVSNVTDMSQLFWKATNFNQPLNNWNVSNVTDMSGMFSNAPYFNQPLNDWDVSNVTPMSGMFYSVSAFNQPLDNWDVSNVMYMENMFNQATTFNQSLANWDVSSVVAVAGMFSGASSFNQDVTAFNYDWLVQGPLSSYFVDGSGLDTTNFDALLAVFKQTGYTPGFDIYADGLTYCDVETYNYLINELNWVIHNAAEDSNCENMNNSEHTANAVSIYPNPVTDVLHLDAAHGAAIEEAKVFNLQGRELLSFAKADSINVENLGAGVYVLMVKTSAGLSKHKLVRK